MSSVATTLAPRLAIERLRSRGGATLDLLAVGAFTASSLLALTVAGGTWMFVTRWQSLPADAAPDVVAWNASYVILAAIACALLVAPILSLGGAAARLGARGRARRLASLRLIGMTGREVVSMSVVETLVQAVIGIVLGSLLYLATLPAWRLVSFQSQPSGGSEMLTPWWLYLGVVALLLLLAVASTVFGLQRVRISPLGVASQQTPPALRWWRLAAFGVVLVGFLVLTNGFQIFSGEIVAFLGMAVMMLLVIGGVNLVGPWVLQLIARTGVATKSPARLIAARRIVGDPKGAWRNVSAVAILGLVAAFTSILPAADDPSVQSLGDAELTMLRDLATGVLVTLAIALVIGAVMTLISQASDVVDRADESVALDRMGVPRRTMAAARRHQVIVPLIITLVISIGSGYVLMTPFLAGGLNPSVVGVALLGAMVGIGLLLTLLAAEATRPIQAGILSEQRRRND